MKKFDYRIALGIALIIGGILLILQKLNILPGAVQYFWAGLLAIGAAIFLYMFFTDRSKWWAAIPGFTLAGMSASAFLLDQIGYGDVGFLAGIGLSFFAVYFHTTRRWWAIIPGGVLLTLAATSALGKLPNVPHPEGIFMIGLGITFLLVGLLARMKWAYIPAAVLLLLGFFLGGPFAGLWGYAWIGLLLLGGIALIIDSLRK